MGHHPITVFRASDPQTVRFNGFLDCSVLHMFAKRICHFLVECSEAGDGSHQPQHPLCETVLRLDNDSFEMIQQHLS
jgi:hypothetical protein